jgi:hypothetical protein
MGRPTWPPPPRSPLPCDFASHSSEGTANSSTEEPLRPLRRVGIWPRRGLRFDENYRRDTRVARRYAVSGLFGKRKGWTCV